MIALHTVAQVLAAEQSHASELESGVLMDRAATALAVATAGLVREVRGTTRGARIVVIAGSGNNGGDALFAGAQLAARGMRVDAIGDQVHGGGLAALRRAGGRLTDWRADRAHDLIAAADVVLDGIVGIGAKGPLRGAGADLVDAINGSGALVVAVDLPSGVDADSGQVPGVAIRADLTVTFGAVKVGLMVAPAVDHVGALRVVDIGIGDALAVPVAEVLEAADVAPFVPEPAFDDHKYRRGVAAVAAGSRPYPGAAVLCTSGALGVDIGMVRYLDRGDDVSNVVLSAHPQVVRTMRVDDGRSNAWAIGPGFPGLPVDADAITHVLRTPLPVVMDAGALTCLAERADLRELVLARTATTVVTPHDGEFARLGGVLDETGRIAGAHRLATSLGAVVLLKGPATVIASPNGATYVDEAGSPALASAGSGDVLSGVIVALLAAAHARGEATDPDAAARIVAAGCWLHGAAGRLAAAGGVTVMTTDIAARLPDAVALARRGA